jgi:hypothetical protein
MSKEEASCCRISSEFVRSGDNLKACLMIDPEIGRVWQKANDLGVKLQDTTAATSTGYRVGIFHRLPECGFHCSQIQHGLS